MRSLLNRRGLIAAAAATAVMATVATAPAMAAPAPSKAKFVVAGDKAVTFKSKDQFKAYVQRHFGVDLSKHPKKPTAKASWAGDYATFYRDWNGLGDNFRVNSGYGQQNLYALNCILWWCTNFDDQVSSVYTHGVPAVLYSETGYRGSAYFIPANTHANVPYSFNDITSSVVVYWS